MRGSEAVVALLRQVGVDVVFGLCGDTSLPLYEALAAGDHGIRHVLTRDERSASFMADAYARLSGKVGVCEGPSGGGPPTSCPGSSGSSVPPVSPPSISVTPAAERSPRDFEIARDGDRAPERAHRHRGSLGDGRRVSPCGWGARPRSIKAGNVGVIGTTVVCGSGTTSGASGISTPSRRRSERTPLAWAWRPSPTCSVDVDPGEIRRRRDEHLASVEFSSAALDPPRAIRGRAVPALPERSVICADPGTPCPYLSAYYRLPQAGRWFVRGRRCARLRWRRYRPTRRRAGPMGDGVLRVLAIMSAERDVLVPWTYRPSPSGATNRFPSGSPETRHAGGRRSIALAYYVASRDLPPGRDEPGPAFLPALLSGALFLLGLVLGCSGGAGGSELPPARPLDGRSIATTAAAMAATILYAVLFPVLGARSPRAVASGGDSGPGVPGLGRADRHRRAMAGPAADSRLSRRSGKEGRASYRPVRS